MSLEFSDELLSAYLDGELSPAERVLVESQMAADPEARQLLDELRALSGEVRDLPRHSAGSGFSQRVVQAALAARGIQAAESAPTGQVTPASRAGTPALPDKFRRGARLRVVLAGVAAVAAAVAMMVWAFNRPGHLPAPGPGPGTIAVEPVVPAASAISPAAEAALTRLRLAIPQEGEAVVLRIRVGFGAGQSPAEALDAAFAAAGLGTRQPSDETTGAFSVASAYQQKLAEKIGGQAADATLAAADAVFVTCPLDMLEKAVAALASQPQSPLEISPLMSGRVVMEADSAGESGSTGPAKPKHFVQRLAADQFRLDKSGSPLAELTPLPLAALDPSKPIRVLILVEAR